MYLHLRHRAPTRTDMTLSAHNPKVAGSNPAPATNRNGIEAPLLRRRLKAENPRSRTAQPPKARRAKPVAINDDQMRVRDALLRFGTTLAGSSTSFTPDREADAFVRTDAFAFLVAVICDEQVKFEAAWNAPHELRRRLGHWDLVRIASEPARTVRAFAEPSALHRWVTKTAERVVAAAVRVLDEYDGDAGAIWAGTPSAAEVRRRLTAFDGIGQKKSAMAVEILDRDLRIPLTDFAGSDIAVDIHVRRVFLRSGLADRDDVELMIEVARALNPDRPGALDLPVWEIGRTHCHPSAPTCFSCPIESACPRLLARGAEVRGA